MHYSFFWSPFLSHFIDTITTTTKSIRNNNKLRRQTISFLEIYYIYYDITSTYSVSRTNINLGGIYTYSQGKYLIESGFCRKLANIQIYETLFWVSSMKWYLMLTSHWTFRCVDLAIMLRYTNILIGILKNRTFRTNYVLR